MDTPTVHHDITRPQYGYVPSGSDLSRALTALEAAEAVRDVCARDLADMLAAGLGMDYWGVPDRLDDYRHYVAAVDHARAVYQAELDKRRDR